MIRLLQTDVVLACQHCGLRSDESDLAKSVMQAKNHGIISKLCPRYDKEFPYTKALDCAMRTWKLHPDFCQAFLVR